MTRPTRSEIDRILARAYSIELDYGEDPKDGVGAYVVEWPGCITAGATREEALANLPDAMRSWVGYRLERGYDVPEPMSTTGGTVVVKMPRSLHRAAVRRAEKEGVSMNHWISTTIARAIGTELKEPPGRYRVRRPK